MFRNEPWEVEKTSPEKASKQKRSLLLTLVALAVADGGISAYAAVAPTWTGLSGKLLGFAVVAGGVVWCSIDSRTKGRILSSGWSAGLFFLLPFVFPAYMVRERGWKAGSTTTAKAVGFVVVLSMVAAVTEIGMGFMLG